MLYLDYSEVKLNLRLRGGGGEVVAYDSGKELACLLEEGLLLGAAVGDVLEGFHGAGHLTHFNEGVDDGEGGLGGTGRLQNGGKHVKSSLGEGMIGDGMLHRLEPVEIFDQLLSLSLLQGETVTRRKLVGIDD